MTAPQSAGTVNTQAYTLTFRGPLHVGDAGVGIEESLSYLPSDTLFSALVVTWLGMGRTDLVDQLDGAYREQPPLLLSSAMPFAGDIRFFPRPLLPTHMDDTHHSPPSLDDKLPNGKEQPRSGKSFRRVRWVSESILNQLITAVTPSQLTDLWQDGEVIQHGSIWLTVDECQQVRQILKTPSAIKHEELSLWQSGQTPKVSIDRMSRQSALYSEGATRFASGCGLWIVTQGQPDWVAATEAALTLLQDSGLGGRRSRGNGAFTLKKQDDWANLPDRDGTHLMMLSRLAPSATDMPRLQDKQSSYQLVTVGGWNGTPGDQPFLRKSVRMLAEGSIIKNESTIPGQLVDVAVKDPAITINHPIYRYGHGLGIGVTIHDQN